MVFPNHVIVMSKTLCSLHIERENECGQYYYDTYVTLKGIEQILQHLFRLLYWSSVSDHFINYLAMKYKLDQEINYFHPKTTATPATNLKIQLVTTLQFSTIIGSNGNGVQRTTTPQNKRKLSRI